MPARRERRLVLSWIALVAILLITFAPSATSALSASTAVPWITICSASNVRADRQGTPHAPAVPHALEHCPYCALHADLAPPPDPRPGGDGSRTAFQAFPVAFARAPRGNPVWASAQPRAPPRFA